MRILARFLAAGGRVDILRGKGEKKERLLLEFLSASCRDFLVIATKSDRLSGNQLPTALRALEKEYPTARIVPFSAKTGAGQEHLWKEIRQAAQRVPAVESPS